MFSKRKDLRFGFEHISSNRVEIRCVRKSQYDEIPLSMNSSMGAFFNMVRAVFTGLVSIPMILRRSVKSPHCCWE